MLSKDEILYKSRGGKDALLNNIDKTIEENQKFFERLEKDLEHGKKEISDIMSKFGRIEEKNRCVRVRFLDALAVKLHNWGDKVKDMSNRIDSPCVIKIGEKK
jgi:uncharacterized protein YoxC